MDTRSHFRCTSADKKPYFNGSRVKQMRPRTDKSSKVEPRVDKNFEKWDLKIVGPPTPALGGDPSGEHGNIHIQYPVIITQVARLFLQLQNGLLEF